MLTVHTKTSPAFANHRNEYILKLGRILKQHLPLINRTSLISNILLVGGILLREMAIIRSCQPMLILGDAYHFQGTDRRSVED